MVSFYDVELTEEGGGLGIVAAEIAVELGGVYASSLFKQVTELAGGLTVKDSLLFKEAETVGGKDLGPLVGVVSGGVASAEYVAE